MITTICGCAVQPTVYQSWGKRINDAPMNHNTKEDISRILGTEPLRCEKIPGKPIVGILLRHDSGTTILGIFPNSPAAGTGLQVGDKIIAVNSKPVHSMEDIIDSTEGLKGTNSPAITIETQRGSYIVTPKYPAEAEQCDWEINGGPIARIGGSAFYNQYGGSAMQGGTTYQRFFRATCRFAEGKAYICRPHWQE